MSYKTDLYEKLFEELKKSRDPQKTKNICQKIKDLDLSTEDTDCLKKILDKQLKNLFNDYEEKEEE